MCHWIFDPEAGLLDLRGEKVSVNSLVARRGIGRAVLAGFECGVTLALAASPALVSRLSLRAEAATHPRIVEARAHALLALHDMVAVTAVQCDTVRLAFASASAADLLGPVVQLAEACAEIVHALTAAWSVLPGRVPAHYATAQQIRTARDARAATATAPSSVRWRVCATSPAVRLFRACRGSSPRR